MTDYKWISVDDRLPDDNEDYLIWDGGAMYTAQYTHKTKDDDGYWLNWAAGFIDVTHWKPLPVPPKEM